MIDAATTAAAVQGTKDTAALLRLEGLCKTFGSLRANDDVSLDIHAGEIHAILGENGAGKSTLMKMIYGVLAPDAGRIFWQGKERRIISPAAARSLGIGMVFQHFSLFETLTVAENIALSVPEKKDVLAQRVTEFGERFGLPVDPCALVHALSVGQRQRVELIRCLLQEPRLIIMDEPTSVLPPSGVAPLFDTLRKLAAQGCAILFISHKLDEIRNLCHRATIMRAGKVIQTVNPSIETNASLTRLMLGSELPQPVKPLARPAIEPALELRGLNCPPSDPFGVTLENAHLAVHPGEILGIAGVSGNGQKELACLVSGETRLADERQATQIWIHGAACGHLDAGQRRALGLAFVPEERHGRGAVPEMDLLQNVLLTAHGQGLIKRGLVNNKQTQTFTQRCIDQMDVRCAGPRAEARSLSGGNLQKFIVAREIQLQPRILIVAQPTWGVDVGAAQTIRQALIRLRDEGVALLVISDELDELLEVSDRIQVIFRGQLSPCVSPSLPPSFTEDDVQTIGHYMTGGFLEKTPHEMPYKRLEAA